MTPTPNTPRGDLQDVVPPVRQHFHALIRQAERWGMKPRITSAGRTCATQRGIYARGDGATQADLCRSAHVMGHAVDLRLSPNTPATYARLGAWWQGRGGTWGGVWSGFGPHGDQWHFHYLPHGKGSVPDSICPAGMSVGECEQVRRDYIAAQNALGAPPARGGGGVLVLGAIAIGLALAIRAR